jgi:tetratricopeptide (TPR) repeat protein
MNQAAGQRPARLPGPYAIAAALAVAAIAVTALATSSRAWTSAPWPFIWPDVALVFFLCLLPLLAGVYSAARFRADSSWRVVALQLAVLLVLPAFYVYVRTNSEASRARRLVEESRFGEARRLLTPVLVLRPNAHLDGASLRDAATRLDAIIARLEDQCRSPLAADASNRERLARARDLAMLGREWEAASVLNDPSLDDLPAASNLQGAISESYGAWRLARDWYRRSLSLPGSSADRCTALAGLAHCERKLGHLRKAEAAYQKLLALSPTAETHFLLAQFYDDTQQAVLAATHARQAMHLAPGQYDQPAQRLMYSGITSQFGCLSAFRSQNSSSVPK